MLRLAALVRTEILQSRRRENLKSYRENLLVSTAQATALLSELHIYPNSNLAIMSSSYQIP
jgi:hypothetical protein